MTTINIRPYMYESRFSKCLGLYFNNINKSQEKFKSKMAWPTDRPSDRPIIKNLQGLNDTPV